MKRILALMLLTGLWLNRLNAQDSLIVYYYENFPFSYTEKGKAKGIEPEIVDEYVLWLKNKKNINVKVTYKAFGDFGAFYNAVKDAPSKVIGLGSVTRTGDREKEVQFSPPYMQNVSVLITQGAVPTIRNKNAAEINAALGKLTALAVNKSSHMKYLESIKKQYVPTLKITGVETQGKVLEGIAADPKVFGYTDIVAYWNFMRNQNKYLKIQKIFNEQNEMFGFIMPMNAAHSSLLSEFFEAGFGFTSTKIYHQILEKYLGYEILESVEL